MNENLPFGSRKIGAAVPVVIIAEIGVNHEGDAAACLTMVEAAARAGADAIKLQTADPSENYPPHHPSFAIYTRARLSPEATAAAFAAARALGVEAFTTTGQNDLEWVARLDPCAYKVSSGLLTHLPVIRRLAGLGKTVLLSTGMSASSEIDEALAAFDATPGAAGRIVMQCTSLYPAPDDTVSLATIRWLAERYGCPGGFSDHTISKDTPALAVAAGARVIEKHFSVDTSRPGFDHGISLDEAGFADMVARVRRAERLFGLPEKRLSPAQEALAVKMRRVIVARNDIAAGATIAPGDVAIMRGGETGTVLLPRDLERVVGARAAKQIARWSGISAGDIVAPD
jgi:sialic acid synthase SpsE